MAKSINRLTAISVKAAISPGRYADGGNLYLVVSKSGSKRWSFMYMRDGRQREAGLGSVGVVTLAVAREKARQMRELLDGGRDPIAARKEKRRFVPTFGEFADGLIEDIESGFRNEKHIYQWRQTLGDAYCSAIRAKRVDEIATEDILRVLQPIWPTKQETAARLRGRLEKVLDAARAKGLRSGENPARWKGNLKELLPVRRKLQRGHQPAMPWSDVPAFIGRLRGRPAISALALEFLILTAARAGEVYGATWGEIDLNAKLWTVPAGRIKAGRAHRVPLTKRAIEILHELMALRQSTPATSFIFPGYRRERPLSNMAFKQLLSRMGETGFVPHGFRSSFRDWCGECTTFPREIAEAALAHSIGNSVEQAYRRGDALEKRRQMMDEWAEFIEPRPSISTAN